MCCWTHDERDRRDLKNEIQIDLTNGRDHCQCKFGEPCRRRATQEDLLCDWCRAADGGKAPYSGHYRECKDIGYPESVKEFWSRVTEQPERFTVEFRWELDELHV